MDLTSFNDREPSDEELALLAGAGDHAAFEALVSRFGAALLSVVEKQVGDHHAAHDLAQEIWIKVFRAISRYRPEGSLRSWLFCIALNHVRDANRRKTRHKVIYIEDFRAASEVTETVDPRIQAEESSAIHFALERVPEPYRTALTLVDVMSFSYEEAAASLDCAVGTVKSRVNRGRFAFRDHYLRSGEPCAERARVPRHEGSEGQTR